MVQPSIPLTEVNNFLVAVRIDRVCPKIIVQNITLWMQNNAEMPSQHLEFHLLDDVERMNALLCATLHDTVHHLVRMN